MSTIVGGLRARLIRDSFQNMLRDSLGARGWFDSGRRHAPITLTLKSYDWDSPIPINTIAISAEGMVGDEMELGSNATEDKWTVYIDFYAETDSLGIDVAHDIRDILRGKIASIGRTGPTFQVYDLTQATPPPVFVCELEDIQIDRARGFTRPHERYWYAIRCDIVDEFYDEDV